MTFVHESAIIDEGVKIGQNVYIWHFSHVLSGSFIGNNCKLGQNVVVGPKVRLGDGCKIQNNVSVYQGITIENDVFCGPSVVFTNVNDDGSLNRKSRHAGLPVIKGEKWAFNLWLRER